MDAILTPTIFKPEKNVVFIQDKIVGNSIFGDYSAGL